MALICLLALLSARAQGEEAVQQVTNNEAPALLIQAGRLDADRYAVPFPGMGQQGRFHAAMADIIPIDTNFICLNRLKLSKRTVEIVGANAN